MHALSRRAPSCGAYAGGVLILFIVLLVAWLILTAAGFMIKGILGVALFVMLFVAISGGILSMRNARLKKGPRKK